ncbi:hypothetical protein AC629_10610 [Bradyrhizobium sp. NAS80.1]|nr:hypothetical protein AC629_10610 [Bradyrhizobium sp. NAS80.1]
MLFSADLDVTRFLSLRYHLRGFKAGVNNPKSPKGMMIVIQWELTMGEVVRFVSKSERERIHLIREARAIYESVFPTAAPANEQGDQGPAVHSVSGGDLLS